MFVTDLCNQINQTEKLFKYNKVAALPKQNVGNTFS